MCEAKCSRGNLYKSIIPEIKAAAETFFRLYTVKLQSAYFYTLVKLDLSKGLALRGPGNFKRTATYDQNHE